LDPDGNATGLTAVLDGNKYFLIAQTRNEICGAGNSACQLDLSAGLSNSGEGMQEFSYNGNTMYLSTTWADNKAYLDKIAEQAFHKGSEVTGDAAKIVGAKFPPASIGLGAVSVMLKGGELAYSDDKPKTIVGAAADEAGAKYTHGLTNELTYSNPGKISGPASEIAGGKTFGGAAEKLMDKRPGSAKNLLKASEGARYQRQQLQLRMLNHGTQTNGGD